MVKGGARRGFSLPELLVVIAIVMILGGLLFPALSSARTASKGRVCAANLSQDFRAISLYMADADGLYPAAKDCLDVALPKAQPARVRSFPMLPDAVLPYARSNAIFECPFDRGMHVSEPQFPEPVELAPTAFKACGMSYEYHTALGMAPVSDTRIEHPSGVNVLADLAGHWHGSAPELAATDNFDDYSEKVPSYRYNMLFVDGHVKLVDRKGVGEAWKLD